MAPSINFGLYRIRYIEGVQPPQKEQRGKADFGNVKKFLFKGRALFRNYVERNEDYCQGLPNMVEDISVFSPSCQF